jgi:RNA polymerase sigma-70 factor (ECF subfamily)
MDGNGFNGNIHEEYAELLNRARSGDESAFAEIYQKSERLVYTTCYRILNNKESAEDAMQETYLALYNSINTIRDGQALVAWLSRTAYFKSCDLGDKLKNDISYDDAIASEDITEEADDDLESIPDKFISVKANREIINDILKKELSKEQYIATLLFYYNELQISEIAGLMHCPENTIKTRLKASRAKIKSSIESYEKINKVSLAGAGAVPFLTRFFTASANDLTIPAIGALPLPSLFNAATQGAQAGNIVQPAQLGNLSQSAQLGNLAQPAQIGNLAQPAHASGAGQAAQLGNLAQPAASAGTAAKAGFLASPVFKVGVIATAVAVVAVPTAIIVGKNIKNTDRQPETKIYEYVPDETEEPEVTTTTESTTSSIPEETTEKPTEPTESVETTPEESSVPTISGITVSDAINETFTDEEGKEHLVRIPQITIPEKDTSKINKSIYNLCYPSYVSDSGFKNWMNINYVYYESEKILSIFIYLEGYTTENVYVYSFDRKTGEDLSNRQILELSGISSDDFSEMYKNTILNFIDSEVAKGGDRKKLESSNSKQYNYFFEKIFTANDGHLCVVCPVWDADGKMHHRATFDLVSGELIAIRPIDIVPLPLEKPLE